jgi:hypothetical protein
MLKKIAKSIQQNLNVLEKKDLTEIVQYINNNSYKTPRIFSDIGEDSAAVVDDEKFVLMTTDRIKTSFIENFPFGAGFSSILVGIDDIYCCGGVPLAASVILSFTDRSKGQQIIEGICEGSRKFQVPIIRGHTNTTGHYYELSTTMIGEIKREDFISAKTAQIGDNIIIISDFDGKVGKANNLYWDTVTFKNSEEVLKKRKVMNVIAKKHLANASKDISNGGIFGTILQLIKYSNVGADVSIKKIQIPQKLINLNYTLEEYIKMYLTTSFIISASNNNSTQLIKIVNEHGLHANIIGTIIKEKNFLKINDDKETIDVIKF